jgi:tripartite ATP-independent transporter DctP family solute receptor
MIRVERVFNLGQGKEKTMKRNHVLSLVAIFGISLLNSFAPCSDSITMKLSLGDGENTNYYRGAMKIAEEVEKATGDKVKIEVYASGQLGSEQESLELCMMGDVDIATIANSKLVSFMPNIALLDQAYLFTNADQAHAAIDGELARIIYDEAFTALGVHYMGAMESGFRNVFSTKPIDSPAAFKGVKIRTMESESHILAFNSFGAIATPMGYSEQFTALQTGAIDACENAIANMLANGFYEYCPYVTWSNHAFVFIMIFISDSAWKNIPEELHNAFREGVRRGYEAQRGYLQEANAEAVDKLKKLNITFFDIDTKELQRTYQAAAKKAGFTFNQKWVKELNNSIAGK